MSTQHEFLPVVHECDIAEVEGIFGLAISPGVGDLVGLYTRSEEGGEFSLLTTFHMSRLKDLKQVADKAAAR